MNFDTRIDEIPKGVVLWVWIRGDLQHMKHRVIESGRYGIPLEEREIWAEVCLLYTSDAADE